MYETIHKMIDMAAEVEDYEMAEQISNLIEKLATTCNCPSDWRDIGERLAGVYRDTQWVYDNLKLYNYEG